LIINYTEYMDRYEKPEAKPSQKIYISNLSMDVGPF
jgi:hypothetical protein